MHTIPRTDDPDLDIARLRENAIDLETAIGDATIDDETDVDRLCDLHRQYEKTRQALARVELHEVGRG